MTDINTLRIIAFKHNVITENGLKTSGIIISNDVSET